MAAWRLEVAEHELGSSEQLGAGSPFLSLMSVYLVTGGAGFIRSRVVECLVCEYEADARAVVRDFATAARISRFPIKRVRGDVRESAAVERAANGTTVILRCAFRDWRTADDQRDLTVGDPSRPRRGKQRRGGATRLRQHDGPVRNAERRRAR